MSTPTTDEFTESDLLAAGPTPQSPETQDPDGMDTVELDDDEAR